AALGLLARQSQVDPKRLAAVGYGVGGTGVLELARAGAELEGVVCVHGELGTPQPDEAKKVSASVLILVGSDDPFIPLTQIGAFEDEMRRAVWTGRSSAMVAQPTTSPIRRRGAISNPARPTIPMPITAPVRRFAFSSPMHWSPKRPRHPNHSPR